VDWTVTMSSRASAPAPRGRGASRPARRRHSC
jgi:hypothetical protein